jgi:hypothetical protein
MLRAVIADERHAGQVGSRGEVTRKIGRQGGWL